jgi:hypothetical protein
MLTMAKYPDPESDPAMNLEVQAFNPDPPAPVILQTKPKAIDLPVQTFEITLGTPIGVQFGGNPQEPKPNDRSISPNTLNLLAPTTGNINKSRASLRPSELTISVRHNQSATNKENASPLSSHSFGHPSEKNSVTNPADPFSELSKKTVSSQRFSVNPESMQTLAYISQKKADSGSEQSNPFQTNQGPSMPDLEIFKRKPERQGESRSNSNPEPVFEDPLETPQQNVPKKLDLSKFAGVFGGRKKTGDLNVKIPGWKNLKEKTEKNEPDLEISNNLTLRTPLGSAGLRKIEAQSPFKLEGGLSLRQDNEPVITPSRKIQIHSPFKDPQGSTKKENSHHKSATSTGKRVIRDSPFAKKPQVSPQPH